MVNHDLARVVLMFLGLIMFLAAITINSMSGFGAESGVFQQSTEDVTLKYVTLFTPANWALHAYDWLYTTPALLPYGFHVSMIANISLNITWLFLFDKELLLPALITSALMTLTDYLLLFFSCHGLKIYGAWLNKYHNVDLWLFRVLTFSDLTEKQKLKTHHKSSLTFVILVLNQVQNGVAVYATWGSLSTVLNLTIYLQYQTGTFSCGCSLLPLLLLLMQLFAWFLLENFYLDEHVRYVVTIYPLVILWLTGTLNNSSSPESLFYIFTALTLAISCVMFVARVALVTWRHHKRPLYTGPSMSPVEIALTQRKIFL
ncbi:uncharacterized protein LOC133933046 [Platichthys flesus]|uniref:uncharacterized protein LOC133933046 n=1 Tax=Platichthys flesus TaxID=8260 RepID=UPI002DBFFA3D|nr:uncharacterized protein LOC133933046 [Platichthys flesus]